MKKINEIKNEKRISVYLYSCNQNCPAWDDDDCHCIEVLAHRLAKYEDIGRDFMELPADEVVPVEVLETSLKIVSVLTIVSKKNKIAKAVFDSVLGTIDKLYGKKAGEKNDKT